MKKIVFYILISLLLVPVVSRAQKYTLLEPLPCIEGVGTCTPGTIQKEIDINGYIGYVFKFSIALAAFLAVLMIIWGGFEYMLSEIPNSKLDGKSKIQNAIWGLLGVLASYLILATIDPRLVEINTNIPAIVINNRDLQGVQEFQNQLAKDTQAFSSDDQRQIKANNSQVASLQKQKDDLNIIQESINADEYKSKIENIDQNIKLLNSDTIKRLGTGQAFNTFTSTISNTDASGDAAAKAQIIDTLSKSQGELNKIQDFEGAQALGKEKDFLVKQINDQRTFEDYIKNYNPKDEKYLKKYIDTFQKNYDYLDNKIASPANSDIVQVKDDPKLIILYKEVVKNRIDTLTKMIVVKKP